MREYQVATQDHLTARLIAAILHKLGETSITISAEDLKSLPPGHVESYGDPFNGTMTYRFRKYDHADPDQQELPLAEHVTGEPRPHTTVATTSATNATTSATNATAAEPGDRDPSKLPAGELTDEELAAEEKSVGKAWDDLSESMQEDGGRGGSPFEHLSERLNEIETEKQRRAYSRD